ncbi:MAG: hypothetical protein ACYC1Q_03555 [Bacteroidia bacterium]
MKITFTKYSILLLAGFLISWWLQFYSPFVIPDYIPGTPIKIDGLILLSVLLAILIFSQKEFLKKQPELTIFRLTLLGTLICFSSEIVFQLARQLTFVGYHPTERIMYFARGVFWVSLFAGALSFLVAFQLKKKEKSKLVLMIIGFILLANLILFLTGKSM